MKVSIAVIALMCVSSVYSAHIWTAHVKLYPTDTGGNNGTGELWFTAPGSEAAEITITGYINGVTVNPDTPHGIHLHYYGDIRSPTGTNTGGHYNPNNYEHGCPDDLTRHTGDMGNFTFVNGTATINQTVSLPNLDGAQSVIGRAVIVHQQRDNCDPATNGDAGGRIMQGVIGIANPGSVPQNAMGYIDGTSTDTAVAVGYPTPGYNGTVTAFFKELPACNMMNVVLQGSGYEPDSTHGFHVHWYGDLSEADGTAASGHYNPYAEDHALPSEQPDDRHVGDVGNVVADANGDINEEFLINLLSYSGNTTDATSIIGRMIIMHYSADQGEAEQPAGAAGPRMSAGVIGRTAQTFPGTLTCPMISSSTTMMTPSTSVSVSMSTTVDNDNEDSASSALVPTLAAVLVALALALF